MDGPFNFSDMPLLWMLEEALDAGLLLHTLNKVTSRRKDLGESDFKGSLSLWWLLEALPIRHLHYSDYSTKHTRM
jgi:hypothetical protein